jgi:hypothetical protein
MDTPGLAQPALKAAEPEAEEFFDVMKAIAGIGLKVPAPYLISGSPFKGPIGIPMTAVAGMATRVVGKTMEQGSSTQLFGLWYRECACRAIMAEAALQAVLRMDARQAHEYGFFRQMEDAHKSSQHIVGKVATALTPYLLEPALRLAVFDDRAIEGQYQPYPTLVNDSTLTTDGNDAKSATISSPQPSKLLAKNLQKVAIARGESDEFVNFLGGILDIMDNAGPLTLSTFGDRLQNTTSDLTKIISIEALQPHFRVLCQRALIGDAALRTIIDMPDHARVEAEILDSMLDTVELIGRKIIEIAPGMTRSLGPLIEQMRVSVKPGPSLPGQTNSEDKLGAASRRPGRSVLNLLTND